MGNLCSQEAGGSLTLTYPVEPSELDWPSNSDWNGLLSEHTSLAVSSRQSTSSFASSSESRLHCSDSILCNGEPTAIVRVLLLFPVIIVAVAAMPFSSFCSDVVSGVGMGMAWRVFFCGGWSSFTDDVGDGGRTIATLCFSSVPFSFLPGFPPGFRCKCSL